MSESLMNLTNTNLSHHNAEFINAVFSIQNVLPELVLRGFEVESVLLFTSARPQIFINFNDAVIDCISQCSIEHQSENKNFMRMKFNGCDVMCIIPDSALTTARAR